MVVANGSCSSGRHFSPMVGWAITLTLTQGPGDPSTSHNDLTYVRFYEYKSTGPGANPTNATRVNRQLTDAQAANYTVSNMVSSNGCRVTVSRFTRNRFAGRDLLGHDGTLATVHDEPCALTSGEADN